MASVRRALAFPFYVIAFILHMLTALFTIIAQKIAGDESSPSKKRDMLSVVVCALSQSLPYSFEYSLDLFPLWI